MERNLPRKPQWDGTIAATLRWLWHSGLVAALILGVALFPALPGAAEDTAMPANGNKASATTDADVGKTATGGCKVSASASASSSSTGSGETVTRESHKSIIGPCGSATANSKSTSGNGAGKSNDQAE